MAEQPPDAPPQPASELLSLPKDLLVAVLSRAPWSCRRICRAFRNHHDGTREALKLTSAVVAPDKLQSMLRRLPRLEELDAREPSNYTAAGPYNLAPLMVCSSSLSRLSVQAPGKADLITVAASFERLESLHVVSCQSINTIDFLPSPLCARLVTLELVVCCFLRDVARLAACTHLTSLSLVGAHLSSVAALAACTKLVKLDLSGCSQLRDIGPLAACVGLRSLRLDDTGEIDGFSALAACTGLRSLSLKDCPWFQDISGLGALFPHLTHLNLPRCGTAGVFDDLSAVTRLTGLADLSVYARGGGDLSPLAQCAELTRLVLRSSSCWERGQHADPRPFDLGCLGACCPRLASLLLGNTRLGVKQLNEVAACPSLTSLSLQECVVLDFAPLAACTRLTHLSVGHATMPSLQRQKQQPDKSSAQQQTQRAADDITALRSCAALVSLAVRSLPLTNVAAVSTLRHLTSLKLIGCGKLSDLRPLAGCIGLRELSLARCSKVRDLSPLASCQHLQDIDISLCSKFNINLQPLASCGQLKRLAAPCCEVADLAPLLSCGALRELRIGKCLDSVNAVELRPRLAVLQFDDVEFAC